MHARYRFLYWVTVTGYQVSFGGDKNVHKLFMVMVAQLNYTENYELCTLDGQNCMANESHLSKAVTKKSAKLRKWEEYPREKE